MSPAQVVGVLALLAAGALPTWWLMDNRLERCQVERAALKAGVEQRDGTIGTLQFANRSLAESLAKQNSSVLQMAEDAKRRESAAVAALSEARRGQDATRKTIAALSARIQAGDGDCSAAVASIRAGL